ncbi:hypothetical protein E24_00048 [Faustovirus]|nr:hypothetical protein PRJ_Fausto_00045 [Faustovirus]AMN82982.1 hypothetical protein E24_00048 [Faustovirus]AMN83969.1 hypothetical protein D5a_00048 [Faustovirus]AMN84952.1 hypothetical protein E23_00048 [Faustovirus]QBR98958.1 BTB/POZ domain-containing protein [Faustovirus mariensis]
MDALTTEQKQALCGLYCSWVKTSWLNLIVQRYNQEIDDTGLGGRLHHVYDNYVNSQASIYNIKLDRYRIILDPTLAHRELDGPTMILCAEVYASPSMKYKTYLELTIVGVANCEDMLKHVLVETFKHAPSDELFAICDNLVIRLPYRFNPDNPEVRTITLAPTRTPGKENYRKVHKFVLADVSKRLEASVYGSGKLKTTVHIPIDCNKYTLDWFISGIYSGELDLSKIKKKQRRNAYQLLDNMMICTKQDLGDKMAIHFGLVDIPPNDDVVNPPRRYYDSDSDSD